MSDYFDDDDQDQDGAQSVRGIEDVDDAKELATAVVIGLGGSGIQTISRVKAAMTGNRPDADALDSVKFLGIDAVEPEGQFPQLPPGVGLMDSEYVNITRDPFDPWEYIQYQLASNSDLQRWWDERYEPEMGQLVDGLKRSRMLGRLAFYAATGPISDAITHVMTDAVRLLPDFLPQGVVGGGGRLKVHVVASSCGGTGSSGLLEVVYRIWAAARDLNLTPEIRVYVYLPGAFELGVSKGQAPGMELMAHKANAFAFFRELDHFVSHGDELEDAIVGPEAREIGVNIPRNGLLKQVFPVDGAVSGRRLADVTDLYEIVAETIYQFTMTNVGRPIIGVKATNTDALLRKNDKFGKRRIYCGLGVNRIVFPGDTLREHLAHRFAHWFIKEGLLYSPPDLPQVARRHPMASRLLDGAVQEIITASQYNPEDVVVEFQAIADEAPDNLEGDPSSATADRLINELKRLAPLMTESVAESFQIGTGPALQRIDKLMNDAISEAGRGLPFGIEVLSALVARINEYRASVDLKQAEAVTAQNDGFAQVEDELLPKLRRTEAAFFANILPGNRERIAKKLGEAIRESRFGQLAAQEAAAEIRFLERVLERVRERRAELEEAVRRLERYAELEDRRFRSDQLIGKDAGTKDTTTFIPGDISPEVEDSRLAVETFEAIVATVGNPARVDDPSATPFTDSFITDFLQKWTERSNLRAPFAYGSQREGEARVARQHLKRLLNQVVMDHVLRDSQGNLRLPSGLRAAAEVVAGGTSTLRGASTSLAQLSSTCCWRIEKGRISPVGNDVLPQTTTAIARHSELSYLDKAMAATSAVTPYDVDDPERVIALSVQWGAPAHALAPVSNWQKAYDLTIRLFEDDPEGGENPVHLDKRWAMGPDQLTQLIPPGFRREDAVDTLAKAMFQRWLFERAHKGADALKVLDVLDATLKRAKFTGMLQRTVVAGSKVKWQLVMVRKVKGKFKKQGTAIDLGSTLLDALEPFGGNLQARQALARFTEAITAQVTPIKLARAVDQYQTSVQRDIEKLSDDDEDLRALLGEVYDSLNMWKLELRLVGGNL